MAIAFAPIALGQQGKEIHSVGDLYYMLGTLVFSGSYATGGDPITAPDFKTRLKQIGLGLIGSYIVMPQVSQSGYLFAWDPINEKMLVFFGDNNNAADGPLIEIPAGAYPAALTAAFTGGTQCVVVGL